MPENTLTTELSSGAKVLHEIAPGDAGAISFNFL
jgi:hypothetical protein